MAPSRHQQPGGRLEAALDELAQERRDHAFVLRGGLDEPQDALFARRGDPERDDDLIVGNRFPIQQQHQPLGVIMPPFMQRLQGLGAGAHEPTRHARLGQPERFRHGFGGRLVIPAGQPAEHAAKQADIGTARRLQLRVCRQRHLRVRRAVVHARHPDGHLLIGKEARADLRPPAGDGRTAIGVRIARPRQGQHLLLQRLLNRVQAERNQGLNHRKREALRVDGYGRGVRGPRGRLVYRRLRSHSWHMGVFHCGANPGWDQRFSMEAPPNFQLAGGQIRDMLHGQPVGTRCMGQHGVL